MQLHPHVIVNTQGCFEPSGGAEGSKKWLKMSFVQDSPISPFYQALYMYFQVPPQRSNPGDNPVNTIKLSEIKVL